MYSKNNAYLRNFPSFLSSGDYNILNGFKNRRVVIYISDDHGNADWSTSFSSLFLALRFILPGKNLIKIELDFFQDTEEVFLWLGHISKESLEMS